MHQVKQLFLHVSRTMPFRSDLDRHLIRAAMVFTFFGFSIQKWNQHRVEMLVPLIGHSPVVFWLLPAFGVRGAGYFLATTETIFGFLIFLGYWSPRLGILGALGSIVTFIGTTSIIPSFIRKPSGKVMIGNPPASRAQASGRKDYDTALALAEAGFVVAAVTHTGDNYRDQSQVGRLKKRPRHIKVVVDYMLAMWQHQEALDPFRVGMFGFSAGGFTALVAIGGTPDMRTVAPHCAAHPDEWSCRMLREHKVDLSANSSMAAPNCVHDPRIVAAVIASPAVGYALAGARHGLDPALAWRQ